MKKKLYYAIGEIAEELGVPTHNIRYWEKEIPSLAPKNRVGGKRAYKQADFDKISELHDLLHNKKFTIEGAKKYLKGNDEQNLFSYEENVVTKRDDILSIKSELLSLLELVQKI